MTRMLDNEFKLYENGHEVYKWGTQVYHSGKFQVGLSNFDLYDGLQGNILCSFFYGELFDSFYLDLFDKYLNSLSGFLMKCELGKIDSTGIGAFGVVGGGIFTLTTLWRFSDHILIRACLVKLISLLTKLIDNNNSLDYIYGVTGALRRLCLVEKYTTLDVSKEIQLCLSKLRLDRLSNASDSGYAHGSWGIYDTLIKCSPNGNTELQTFVENRIVPISSNGVRNSRWEHSWCNGSIGKLVLLLTLYGSGRINEKDSIMNDYYRIKKCLFQGGGLYPMGLCHGIVGFTDITYTMKELGFITSNEHEGIVTNVIDKWRLKQYRDYQITSNGLMTGRLGIAYQLMRMQFPNKIPSILM